MVYCKKKIETELGSSIYGDIMQCNDFSQEIILLGTTKLVKNRSTCIYFLEIYVCVVAQLNKNFLIIFTKDVTEKYQQLKGFSKIKTNEIKLQSPVNHTLWQKRKHKSNSDRQINRQRDRSDDDDTISQCSPVTYSNLNQESSTNDIMDNSGRKD